MKIIYAQEFKELKGKSIFLAGPTPRNNNVKDWRIDVIEELKNKNFVGTIIVPTFEDKIDNNFAYEKQIEWELEYLEKSDLILFWIPRNLKTLPGFTTNIEFGFWLGKNPKKIIVGIPEYAEKCDYIIYMCKKYKIPLYNSIKDIIEGV